MAAIAALGLTGCSENAGDASATRATPIPVAVESEAAEPSETTTPKPSETPTPEPTTPEQTEESVYGESVTSERGNLVKEIGQVAGTVTDTGETLMQFTITAIEPNFECNSGYSEPPANGNFIAVTMDIQTTAALAQVEDMPYYTFSEYDFKVIGPDGTRENDSTGNAFMCLDSADSLPSQIGPGEHVVGKVVLDSKYTSGALVLSPGWMWGTGAWEWVF
ncbi:MAG: hypothetical protein EOL89_02350 [Actinobacteria bacterium]|nr:hypothetical protein [Actinomycetota bacterium]